ncbi:MAG TPA: Gfo/Idh/MocA family oxidoreductase, partial [Puia sp.]|nr:Gfo/Idh/MocA family oxidoreductase [Puia sp.]
RAFLKAPGVKVIAVTDLNKTTAQQMGDELDAIVYETFEELLSNINIQLIYIATPPFLHYTQSKLALLAGKHVICEKPAAFKTSEAEELAALARSKQLLYTVNLMQRYNPLFKSIYSIIQENILGNFLHGYFENYASNEKLSPEHWFWDVTKSGGIFIEHGVHFFDLYAGWLGEGKIIGAWQLTSHLHKKHIIDRVQATVLYKGGIVNFYHGFDQPEILDRQEFKLQFELGEITMYGWVPVKMKLHGLLQKGELEKLKEIVGSFSITHHNVLPIDLESKGSFKDAFPTDYITMEYENILGKQNLYRQMLTDMIADQHCWIVDRKHIRIIDDKNAILSTRMAEDATIESKKLRNRTEIIV